jgi:protein gp37
MGTTKIEWCEKSWNPITGCSPISEGCQNCYAQRMANRLKGRYGYPEDEPFRVTFHPERLEEPLHWKKPSRIFVCSMGDLFHPSVTLEMKGRVLNIFHKANWHNYLILTKRPERMDHFQYCCGGLNASHIWLGVSVENQRTADERIPILLQIPAAKRFVSVEPMLEPLDIKWAISKNRLDIGAGFLERGMFSPGMETLRPLDWVICGGETGPRARPINPDWARSLRDQCQAAGVPFFFKQMSKKEPIPKDLMIRQFPGKEG